MLDWNLILLRMHVRSCTRHVLYFILFYKNVPVRTVRTIFIRSASDLRGAATLLTAALLTKLKTNCHKTANIENQKMCYTQVSKRKRTPVSSALFNTLQ